MSHSLNSFKRGYTREYRGTTSGVIKGDTWSLDYSSCSSSLGFGMVFGLPKKYYIGGSRWVLTPRDPGFVGFRVCSV